MNSRRRQRARGDQRRAPTEEGWWYSCSALRRKKWIARNTKTKGASARLAHASRLQAGRWLDSLAPASTFYDACGMCSFDLRTLTVKGVSWCRPGTAELQHIVVS